jgi:hypothetical protein
VIKILHPDIELRKSNLHGKGLFAKSFIPRGTVLWAYDRESEIAYYQNQFDEFSKKYQKYLIKYAYWWKGKICLCTDVSKFWNHSCDPNTAPVPSNSNKWDFAIRDIKKDEEITYDYGLIMDHTSIQCYCSSSKCRETIVKMHGNSKIMRDLKAKALEVEHYINKVPQPLLG